MEAVKLPIHGDSSRLLFQRYLAERHCCWRLEGCCCCRLGRLVGDRSGRGLLLRHTCWASASARSRIFALDAAHSCPRTGPWAQALYAVCCGGNKRDEMTTHQEHTSQSSPSRLGCAGVLPAPGRACSVSSQHAAPARCRASSRRSSSRSNDANSPATAWLLAPASPPQANMTTRRRRFARQQQWYN